MEINCRYHDGLYCTNGRCEDYGNQCTEPFECMDRQNFFNSTDETLHRHLVLEKDTLRKISRMDAEPEVKKHLNSIYSSKVELLEELIREIIE